MLTYDEWLIAQVADALAARLAAALAPLEQEIMDLKEAVAKLSPQIDAAVAEINTDKAKVADLTAQLATAQAAAPDPADVQAISDAADKLAAAINPPAPAPTEPVQPPPQ